MIVGLAYKRTSPSQTSKFLQSIKNYVSKNNFNLNRKRASSLVWLERWSYKTLFARRELREPEVWSSNLRSPTKYINTYWARSLVWLDTVANSRSKPKRTTDNREALSSNLSGPIIIKELAW